MVVDKSPGASLVSDCIWRMWGFLCLGRGVRALHKVCVGCLRSEDS